MTSRQSTSAQIAPLAQLQLPTATARRPRRAMAAFVVGLAGLLIAASIGADEWWSILLWLPVGLLVGSIARTGRLVWIVWLTIAAYYPIATVLGAQHDTGPFWYLGAILGAAILSAGFAAGTAIGSGTDPWTRSREAWRGLGRLGRRAVVVAVAISLVATAGYAVYAGNLGSQMITRPPVSAKYAGCHTPATRFGWSYEAINYDPADDARLAAENQDMTNCHSQGAAAGSDVVTTDGIPIAGWYIPSASGPGPTGPTVIVVHGWKANKSAALKYATPFHDQYNVVLLDLRNVGRSGAADTTWGLREQLDVRAMIDWLERTKHPSWIAAMGNSMGGVAVLAEAVTDSRIRALILDSMHASSLVSIGDGAEVENGYPSLPTAWAVVIGVAIRLGADWTVVDPEQTIARVGDRPVLLTHGTADVLDRPAKSAERNFHTALDAGVPVELQYCRGATHGSVIDKCPADWARWVTSFLQGALART